MYPRARLDALSDAVFGVAMTLLVLDVRLPEEFHTDNANELLRALGVELRGEPHALLDGELLQLGVGLGVVRPHPVAEDRKSVV